MLLCALLTAAFLFDWWPALRGGYGWRWPYVQPELSRLPRLLPTLLTLAIYSLGLRGLWQRPGWLFLLWCFLGAFALPIALLFWWGHPPELLFARTLSGMTTGGFALATQIQNPAETLRQWPALMPGWEAVSSHMAVSPPLWPLTYYSLMQWLAATPALSEVAGMAVRPYLCHDVPVMELSNGQLAAAWLGMAAPLWVALAIFPLYGLARQAAGGQAARWAAAWWPLIPSLAMFLGSLNSPYPLLAATLSWLLWGGLVAKRPFPTALLLTLAGSLTAVTIFISFAFVPFLLFAGLLAWIAQWKQPEESWGQAVKRPFIAGAFFGTGLLLVQFAYTAWTGHTILDIWQSTTLYHFELDRPYLPWLWLHAWDFIIFFGPPAFALFLLTLFSRPATPVRHVALALSLTLLIVLISGTARGETGRIWSIFMPIALVGTAVTLHHSAPRYQLAFSASQAAWLITLYAVLISIGSGYDSPPDYAAVAFAPGPNPPVAVAADFGDSLRLQAFSARYEAETERIILDLYWEARRQIAIPYFFAATLVAPDGRVQPSVNWQPFDYQFPTTCWYQVAPPLMDRIALPVGEPPVSGEWWISLAAFALGADNQPLRLPVVQADGAADDQIGLGPVLVFGE